MATATVFADIDSHMDHENLDVNYGSATSLWIGTNYVAGVKSNLWRPIMNFDVSALSGKTINTAKLSRTVFFASPAGFNSYLSRCTRPSTWTEGGVTWNKYDGTTNWTAAGGDFDDTGPPAKINYAEPTASGVHDIEGLKDLVEDAIDNHSGILSIILRPVDEDPGTSLAVNFRSTEVPTQADHPKLVVDYTPVENRRRVVPKVS